MGKLLGLTCSLANLMYGDFFDRNEKPCRPFANFEVYEFLNQLSQFANSNTVFHTTYEQFWDFLWGEDYFQNIWPTRRFEGFVRWICSVMWMAQPCNAAGSFLISQWFPNPPTPKSVQTFGKMTIWLEEAVLHFWLMFFLPWNWLSFRYVQATDPEKTQITFEEALEETMSRHRVWNHGNLELFDIQIPLA